MKSKAVIHTLIFCKLGAGKSDLPSLFGGKQRHSPVNTALKYFPKGWYSPELALFCLTHVLPPSFSLGSCGIPAVGQKSNERTKESTWYLQKE